MAAFPFAASYRRLDRLLFADSHGWLDHRRCGGVMVAALFGAADIDCGEVG